MALAAVGSAFLPAVVASAEPADEIATILARVPLRPAASSEQSLRDWSQASDADFEAYHLLAIHGSAARRTGTSLEFFRASLGFADVSDSDSFAAAELAAASPFGLRFEWNNGRLAALSDIGMRRRGLSPTLLATEFLRTFEEPLAQLLRLSPRENLAVSAVEFGDGISTVEARHLIDGIPVRSSNVQLFVSGSTHYFGPDVLLEVHFNLIGTDPPSPIDLIDAEELPILAEQILLDSGFRSVAITQEETALVVCCQHVPCHHAYLTTAAADGKIYSVEIDAYGGNLMSMHELTVESAGDIKYKGPIAYDANGDIPTNGTAGDVDLPWMYGSIWDYCTQTSRTAPYITDTDSNGHYDGSGGTGVWWIGMVSKETTAQRGRVARWEAGSDWCAGTLHRQPISFNPGANVSQTWATNYDRNAGLAYFWINYGLSAIEHLTLELPNIIYFEAGTSSGGGSMMRCANDNFHIEFYTGNGRDEYLHYGWTHEFGHTFAYCATITGVGCGYTPPAGYKLMEAFSEGAADLSTLWLTKGRYLPNLNAAYTPYTPDFTWGGTDTSQGDDYIDYYEILQKTCTANNQCASGNCAQEYFYKHLGNPDTTADDAYKKCYCSSSADCDAGQTCVSNKCWVSCATNQNCRTHFGMDDHVICVDGRCHFHGKFNNRMFVNMWNRFRLHIGWERAIKYIYKAMGGVTENTTYQERAGSHYEKLKAQATHEKFEVARAFSSVKPSFSDWPDDMTNNWWVAPHISGDGPSAHIVRVPWDPSAYSQFNYAGDTDYFTFRARPGKDYRVWTSYTSAAVDACISIYQWSSAHSLAARDTANCFDGFAGGSDLTWSGDANGGWYQVRISNEAGGTGSYRINLQMQGDDHADWSWSNFKWRDADPIAHGQTTIGVTTEQYDTDHFKLYVPNEAAITAMDIYLLTSQGTPVLYLDWGGNEANPNPPVARDSFSGGYYFRYNIPVGEKGWYYMDIENPYPTTVRTVLYVLLYCGADICSTQHDFGSRTSPYLIQIPWGNTLAQSLHNGADEDWYAIDLQEAEHLSINAYGSYVSNCSLQLSLYADEEQPYYNCNGSCTVFSGAGIPQYIMRQVGFGANAYGSNLHYVAEKDGRYYVKVASGNAQQCEAYTLSMARGNLGAQTNPIWDYQTPDF